MGCWKNQQLFKEYRNINIDKLRLYKKITFEQFSYMKISGLLETPDLFLLFLSYSSIFFSFPKEFQGFYRVDCIKDGINSVPILIETTKSIIQNINIIKYYQTLNIEEPEPEPPRTNVV